MHKLYDLKEKLMQELEDYSENGKFSKDDVESIKYIASAIDHICNIVEEGDEYSNMYYGDGGSYEDGTGSYARGGNRGGGRSYARGRGRNARRDSMGRYSRANDDMIEQLRMMMQEAPDERTRQEFQRFITKVEQM